MAFWQKKSAPLDEATIAEAINKIQDSRVGKGLVDGGFLQGVHIDGDKVYFTLLANKGDAEIMEPLRQAAEASVQKLKGVGQAVGVLTNEKSGGGGSQGGQAAAQAPQEVSNIGIGQVRHIIAVASGKGGVGKSTIAANLALALQAIGLKAGLLDADIYGPSQPLMMGASGKPESDGKSMKPHIAHGIPLASIGFMVDVETPMIWRGPMVQSALMQLLQKVEWGALDVLVLDMPPGTGDTQLTLSQQVPLTGAVIVSTPQDMALLDAVKAVNMFEKVNVPLLGLVENMSYFLCPKCGDKTEIFSSKGAEAEATKRGIPFLGALPLALEIRENSDNGTPIVALGGDNVHREAFLSMARLIAAALEASEGGMKSPEIVFS